MMHMGWKYWLVVFSQNWRGEVFQATSSSIYCYNTSKLNLSKIKWMKRVEMEWTWISYHRTSLKIILLAVIAAIVIRCFFTDWFALCFQWNFFLFFMLSFPFQSRVLHDLYGNTFIECIEDFFFAVVFFVFARDHFPWARWTWEINSPGKCQSSVTLAVV